MGQRGLLPRTRAIRQGFALARGYARSDTALLNVKPLSDKASIDCRLGKSESDWKNEAILNLAKNGHFLVCVSCNGCAWMVDKPAGCLNLGTGAAELCEGGLPGGVAGGADRVG